MPTDWLDATWYKWNQTYITHYYASNTTTTATFYNNYIANTWAAWNEIGTNSTGSIRYVNDTSSGYYVPSWEKWNVDYEETAEQKRERAERERVRREQAVLENARRYARAGAALTDAQKALLTDDELRNWEDVIQRLAEEKLERERAAARQKEEWAAAEAKAERLLISLLDAEGKREWLEYRRVSVTAPSGRQYRLFPLWAGGVALMGEGDARVATLCVHPRERIPDCDVIVGNMMAIQHSEEHVLKIAILHGGEWPAEVLDIRRGRQVRRENFVENGQIVGQIEVPQVA